MTDDLVTRAKAAMAEHEAHVAEQGGKILSRGLMPELVARIEADAETIARLVEVDQKTKALLWEISKGPSVGQLVEPWVRSIMSLSKAALSRMGGDNDLHTR